MKKLFLFLVLVIIASCKTSGDLNFSPEQSAKYWSRADKILADIKPPLFKKTTFDILKYGAKADGKTNSLPAIKAAIEACNKNGGGIVLVPAGTYHLEGPIHLKSNVNLHITEGATLKFSTNPIHYLPVVFTRWEGVECFNYSPLVYAFEQKNIAITGKGTLDGQSGNDNWWKWANKVEFGWKKGMPSQADDHSRPKLFNWNTAETPVGQRILGKGSYLRPNFLQPYRCKNILIEGITIRNSPMWVIHPVLSENITIKDVTVISHGPNSDGCDPESCKNVLIKKCYFDTGDDCIALKSGRNQDGRRISKPIENVVVQDCKMKDGHGGVVIGSEVSGGARNIFAENCEMDSPNLDRALRIKTNKARGGTIEGLFFRNIQVGEVKEAVVRVNMNYTLANDTNQVFIPIVRNILVEKVNSTKSAYGILIDGYDAEHQVNGVFIRDCKFSGAAKGDKIDFAKNLFFENYYLNGKLQKSPGNPN
jgi:polygalacturonase